MQRTITIPDIGDFRNVPVVELLVQPGETVEAEQPLLALESDKATLEVPSPFAGTLVTFFVELGREVSAGDEIALIESAEVSAETQLDPEIPPTATTAPQKLQPEKTPDVAAPSPSCQASLNVPPVAPVAGGGNSFAHATPSVRALARELGVDLGAIAPTGPKNRILRKDLHAYIKARLSEPAGGTAAPAPAPKFDFSAYGPIERQPLTRLQCLSGANLHRTWADVPHVTNFDNADVSDLEAFRKSINGEPAAANAKLTMVTFLLKASALALRAYPRFNSSLDGGDLILKGFVNVGFAVDTPKGLVVPVVRDCDRKGMLEISQEVAQLAQKARDGKLRGADMEGGCFSVSSLGGIGGSGFTPIINAPEVAILGAARTQVQPVWDGNGFVPRSILPLSLSWDHRVVDGVAAAQFLGHISKFLGDFRRALL